MVLDHLVIQSLGNKNLTTTTKSDIFNKNELSEILRFGAEELFKQDDEEGKEQSLEDLDIDDILARTEISEGNNEESTGSELLNAFKI